VNVAASTSSVPDCPLRDILERLADLEYTNAELVISRDGIITPQDIVSRSDSIVQLFRLQRRITPIAVYYALDPSEPHYFDYFRAICRFAKALKIVVITVRSSIPGTPYNEEIERLRKLVEIGMNDGVVVGLLTESGRIADTPETIASICKSVAGLEITLDPSYFITGHPKSKDYEGILQHVCHIRLRDSSENDFQVRVGQGVLEFSKLVSQLNAVHYRRVLCVDLSPLPDVDNLSELRKMRLLLESLL
jgi:sugar phosphate isomerase/epimerase